MKRKIYIALGLVVLFGVAVVWVGQHPTPHFVGGFSPKDFKEIQKVIRQTMWRGAFPNFSTRTVAATPGSLWCLATSRIEQVDVFPGGTECRVHVQTPQGIQLFGMRKSSSKSGQTNWQIWGQRLAGQALIKRLESWRGFAKFAVNGGVGLLGGRLPGVFYTPAVYPDTVPTIPTTEPLGLDLNPISISFLRDDSKPTASKQDVILSEGQFSGWLSNRAKLELRP
jgi:hypothetical protein